MCFPLGLGTFTPPGLLRQRRGLLNTYSLEDWSCVASSSSPAKTAGCCQVQRKWEYRCSRRGSPHHFSNKTPHWTLAPPPRRPWAAEPCLEAVEVNCLTHCNPASFVALMQKFLWYKDGKRVCWGRKGNSGFLEMRFFFFFLNTGGFGFTRSRQ